MKRDKKGRFIKNMEKNTIINYVDLYKLGKEFNMSLREIQLAIEFKVSPKTILIIQALMKRHGADNFIQCVESDDFLTGFFKGVHKTKKYLHYLKIKNINDSENQQIKFDDWNLVL